MRALTKSITYRFLGTVVTFIVAYAVTGDTTISFGVSSLDFFGKIALYYIHEKVWERI